MAVMLQHHTKLKSEYHQSVHDYCQPQNHVVNNTFKEGSRFIYNIFNILTCWIANCLNSVENKRNNRQF